MSNQLVWQDRFSVGVEEIDKDHQKLLKIVNKLFTFSDESQKSHWACMEGIKYFKDHAVNHFANEEAYMDSIGYKGVERHRRIHTDFRQKILPALEQELVRTKYSMESVDHFLGVCVGWLIGHTLTEDQTITGRAESLWENLLPEEEHDAMVQMIIKLLNDLFRLDSNVISESYGGEKFGKGIYYRLVYANKKGQKCESILVFEESTLLNTVGRMMDENAKKLTVMMVNAARYTARQFVDRILLQFPPMEDYELKSENLLTYEQFQMVFERDKPQFSVLFDTGVGYFSYCSFIKQLPGKAGDANKEQVSDVANAVEAAHAIRAENAMEEVGNYLRHNEEEQREIAKKKKILVVDDSPTVLQAMQQLLSESYDITTAHSGLSAIRCIILDRPDLVLLDYEMPVCDGSQVLGMIRGDESMADIAVMFLTGKSDPESIKKVLALKPEGYLLKTLPPADIRKSVDTYFSKQK